MPAKTKSSNKAKKKTPSPFPPTGKDRIWVLPSYAALPTAMVCRTLLMVCFAWYQTMKYFPTDMGLDTKQIQWLVLGVAFSLCCILYGCQGPRLGLFYRLFGLGVGSHQFYRRTLVKEGYEAVEEAFAKTLAEGKETSIQFALYVKGELVVDLAGSLIETNARWSSVGYDNPLQVNFDSDKYSSVWSSSKVVTSILMAWLVDQGHLDYKKKICEYWPEFTGGGKEDITVEQLLKHNSGLQWAPVEELNLEDFFPENLPNGNVSKILESMTCWHPPKWTNLMLYHGRTGGWICNEIARRVDPKKRTLGAILREEFAEKLGIQDECYLGLPPKLCNMRNNLQMRNLEPSPKFFWVVCNKLCQYLHIPCSMYWKFYLAHTALVTYRYLYWMKELSYVNPKNLSGYDLTNQPEYKQGESPASNLHASARAVATIANALATRDPLIFKPDENDTMFQKLSADPETRYLMPMPPPLFSEGRLLPMTKVTFNDGGFSVMSRMDTSDVKTHIPSVPGVPYSLGWFGFNGSVTAFHPRGDFAICFQPLCFNDLDPVARLEKLSQAMMECGRRIHGDDFGTY